MTKPLKQIYIGSQNLIRLTEMEVSLTGLPLEEANATWNLKDSEGDSLGNGAFTESSETPGDYSATISAAISGELEPQTIYSLEINVNSGQDFRKIPVTACYRGSI